MEISDEEAKRLNDAISALMREVLNLHRDVTELTQRFFPGETFAKELPTQWPPVKTVEQVCDFAYWTRDGLATSQGYVGEMRARLDVIVNDAHGYENMKEHLKTWRSRQGKDVV